MKRVIIYPDYKWVRSSYMEWDLLLLRPSSMEEYKERHADDNYSVSRMSQDKLIEKRHKLYWDKWILGRVNYITQWYKGTIIAKVDFVRIQKNGCRRYMYPLGRGWNYMNIEHFNVMKILDRSKIDGSRNWTWLEAINKLRNSKDFNWVPRTHTVTNTSECGWWKDMDNTRCDSIIAKVNYRRSVRAQVEEMHRVAENELTSTQNVN